MGKAKLESKTSRLPRPLMIKIQTDLHADQTFKTGLASGEPSSAAPHPGLLRHCEGTFSRFHPTLLEGDRAARGRSLFEKKGKINFENEEKKEKQLF